MKVKKFKFKKRRAITLVELIIYLSLTMIILVVVIDLVTRIAQNRAAVQGQTLITQNARFMTDRLNLAISQASAISGSYPGDKLNLTVNSSAVSFFLEKGQIFYEEGGTTTPLTDQHVTVAPVSDSESIFKKMTNGSSQSVQIRFKITSKLNNFSRDFETAAVLEGK